MNTVQHGWEDYKSRVVSKEAGQAQLDETKQAFYAGAFVMLGLASTISENYNEEQACNILEGIETELTDYIKSRIKR